MIQSKARLDEAEALCSDEESDRIGQARKALLAAEAAHKPHKADYDYQSNIPSPRGAAGPLRVEMRLVEVSHLRNSCVPCRRAGDNPPARSRRQPSFVTLRLHFSGTAPSASHAGCWHRTANRTDGLKHRPNRVGDCNVPKVSHALIVGTLPISVAALRTVVSVSYLHRPHVNRRHELAVCASRSATRRAPDWNVSLSGFQNRRRKKKLNCHQLVFPDEAFQRVGDRRWPFSRIWRTRHFECAMCTWRMVDASARS